MGSKAANDPARAARVEHMRKNWDRYKLATYPWGRPRGDEARFNREYEMAKEMVARGLYSPTCGLRDITTYIPGLVEEAKKEETDGR